MQDGLFVHSFQSVYYLHNRLAGETIQDQWMSYEVIHSEQLLFMIIRYQAF